MSEKPSMPGRGGKQMRKGTRSCLECRRRKARCIFRPEISSACVECFSRGTSCRDQGRGNADPGPTNSNKSSTLDERVAHLEKVLAFIPHNNLPCPLPQSPESLKLSPPAIPEDLNPAFLPTGNHERAPLTSMIEKTISGLRPNDAIPSRTICPENRNDKKRLKDFKTSQLLRSLFPSTADLNLILESTSDWWSSWNCLFSVISDAKHRKSLSEFIIWGKDNRNPVFVSLALLCVVISIQQTQPGTFDNKLTDPLPLRDLMDECLSTIDSVVIADSEYSGSCQGIEITVFQAKCYVNLGQPQKAWLLFRRAISLAQLIGLHREGNLRSSDHSIAVDERRNAWWTLNILDRFLSLVLGLSYAVSDDTYGYHTANVDSEVDIISYRRKLALFAAKIMERNKGCPDPSVSVTLEIDIELSDLNNRLPLELRDCAVASTPKVTYERLMARFWHHQLRVFLHLPFAFRSQTQSSFQISHDACFSASREMLQLYHTMRMDSHNAFHMCRGIDFQAFTAALLLLLSYLGYGGLIMTCEEKDIWLIDATVDILRTVSAEYGGMVAAQSVQVLSRLRSGLHQHGSVHQYTKRSEEKIAVPYFGMITISSVETSSLTETQKLPQLIDETEDGQVTGNLKEMDFVTDYSCESPRIDIDWDAIINMDLDQEWN